MSAIDAIWQELLDKDDRTSPAECPEMLLITQDELRDYLQRAVRAAYPGEQYAILWNGPPQRFSISRQTAELALSAIRASQERDYYDNFAEAQKELEEKLA